MTTTPDPVLSLRTGFEVELLAPRGSSRAVLAAELATRAGGSVRTIWHTDSEPSLVPGMGRFLHLTPGFQVLDPEGGELCLLVDDITINADLDPGAPPQEGWLRILTDEIRLLRLMTRHCDPASPIEKVLDPVAALWGSDVEALGPAWRVSDTGGATIALAARLPGERERPCEVVTPPISTGHLARLDDLLGAARDLAFTVPVEAAVHLHVDAQPFREVHAFANVVRLFGHWREALWELLGTNPACRRLAPLPEGLLTLVEVPPATWPELARVARTTGITKFADVNLLKVVAERPDRHTLEVRILPGSLQGADIVAHAQLVEALLRRCLLDVPLPLPSTGSGSGSAAELLAVVAP